MKRQALYFGTFNPLHIGHVTILEYLSNSNSFDAVSIVVSPQSPFKEGLVQTAAQRLECVKNDIKKLNLNVNVLDIEFNLSPPYYTINTLRKIEELMPGWQQILVMGADNVMNLEKWYKADDIINNYEIWVYPREGYDVADDCRRLGLHLINAPIINISSTEIREKKRSRGI